MSVSQWQGLVIEMRHAHLKNKELNCRLNWTTILRRFEVNGNCFPFRPGSGAGSTISAPTSSRPGSREYADLTRKIKPNNFTVGVLAAFIVFPRTDKYKIEQKLQQWSLGGRKKEREKRSNMAKFKMDVNWVHEYKNYHWGRLKFGQSLACPVYRVTYQGYFTGDCWWVSWNWFNMLNISVFILFVHLLAVFGSGYKILTKSLSELSEWYQFSEIWGSAAQPLTGVARSVASRTAARAALHS